MAEAWITVTEANIRTAMAGEEFETVRNAAKYGSEADPVAGRITSVSNVIRGFIARDRRNRLGPVGTIPECCLEIAIAMIVWRLMGRKFGEVLDPGGLRKEANSEAERQLRDIAKGEGMSIPYPEDPIDDSRPVSNLAYSNASGELAEMTREDQEGSSI